MRSSILGTNAILALIILVLLLIKYFIVAPYHIHPKDIGMYTIVCFIFLNILLFIFPGASKGRILILTLVITLLLLLLFRLIYNV